MSILKPKYNVKSYELRSPLQTIYSRVTIYKKGLLFKYINMFGKGNTINLGNGIQWQWLYGIVSLCVNPNYPRAPNGV